MAFYHSQEEELEPMSPSSQSLNSHHLSLCILGIAESEIPIDVDKVAGPVRDGLLRFNPAFSALVVRKNGRQWWKQVEVRVEDHFVIPTFPQGLSPESYSHHFDEYLSKIGLEQLPETRPLWELHFFLYPTRTSAGTLVLKMSHALGDGFSLMGAFLSVLKRADKSSMPLTFPSSSKNSVEKNNICTRYLNVLLGCFYSVLDTVKGVVHTAWLGDDPSPVRSGTDFVEYLPKHTTRITFSLDDVRQVKSKVGVTVNDVVVGVIFYGVDLYTKTVDCNSRKLHRTALVVLNTRMLMGYRNLDEMSNQKMWGNRFSFMHIPMPSCSDGKKVDLKRFILQARNIIKRNRSSMAVHLNGVLLYLMDRLRGPERVSRYVHSILKNTSFAISNLVGPMEKLIVGDHPISSFYFTVAGVPQSLLFTVMSYSGKLTIVISGEKGFIDSELLASCMNEAFQRIVQVTAV